MYSKQTSKQKKPVFEEESQYIWKSTFGFSESKQAMFLCYWKAILVLELMHPFRQPENELNRALPLDTTDLNNRESTPSRLPETAVETKESSTAGSAAICVRPVSWVIFLVHVPSHNEKHIIKFTCRNPFQILCSSPFQRPPKSSELSLPLVIP